MRKSTVLKASFPLTYTKMREIEGANKHGQAIQERTLLFFPCTADCMGFADTIT